MEDTEKAKVIEVEKDFSVDVETLFKAWTEEEQLKQWWHPMGNDLEKVKNELQEGGEIEYDFQNSGYRVTGTYKEYVPNEKLVYSWDWDFPEQQQDNGSYVLTITFSPKESGSSIHVIQEGFAEAEQVEPHEEGWEKGLESLKSYLEKTSPTADGGESTQDTGVQDKNVTGDRSGGYNELPEQVKVGGAEVE